MRWSFIKPGFILACLLSTFTLHLAPTVADDLAGAAAGEESVSAEGLQLGCEDYRRTHYNQGTITLRTEKLKDDGDGGIRAASEVRVTTWFDGECLRTDTVLNGSVAQAAVCGDKYIWSSTAEAPVTIAPLSEYADPIDHLGLIHPRWIGTGYNPIESLSSGQEYRCLIIGNKVFSGRPSVEKEKIDGVDAWRIEYYREGVIPSGIAALLKAGGSGGGHIAATAKVEQDKPTSKPSPMPFSETEVRWIAPSQGYALLRSESRTSYPNDEIENTQSLNASYKQDLDSGVWYPAAISHITRHNGRVVSGSRTFVEKLSFNKPPAEAFELAGFGLPKDRRVNDRTQGPAQIAFFWDGERLVRIPKSVQFADLETPEAQGNRRGRGHARLLLWGNAILLAILGSVLLVRHYFRTRRVH